MLVLYFPLKAVIKCPLQCFHSVHSNRLLTIHNNNNNKKSLNYVLFIVQYEFLVNGGVGGKQPQ